jgi:hypothetical protein
LYNFSYEAENYNLTSLHLNPNSLSDKMGQVHLAKV